MTCAAGDLTAAQTLRDMASERAKLPDIVGVIRVEFDRRARSVTSEWVGDHRQSGLRRLEAADAGHRRGGSQPARRPGDGCPRLAVDTGAAAMWAAGAGVVCGAIALQDSPGGRVQLVVIVALQMGVAVLVGSLTSAYTVVFIVVIAVWCLAAGMQWALGKQCGPRRGRRQRPTRRCAAGRAIGDVCRAADDPDDRRGLCAGGADRGLAAATLAHAERCAGVGLSVPG